MSRERVYPNVNFSIKEIQLPCFVFTENSCKIWGVLKGKGDGQPNRIVFKIWNLQIETRIFPQIQPPSLFTIKFIVHNIIYFRYFMYVPYLHVCTYRFTGRCRKNWVCSNMRTIETLIRIYYRYIIILLSNSVSEELPSPALPSSETLT